MECIDGAFEYSVDIQEIYFLFIFPYFREHVINIHESHIRKLIIIIRTGVVVRDVITYYEVNSLVIIWNIVWNIV